MSESPETHDDVAATFSRTYLGATPLEVVRDDEGRVIGDIVENDGKYQVWKKEPVRVPPRRRHTLVAAFATIEEAREQAPALLRDGG